MENMVLSKAADRSLVYDYEVISSICMVEETGHITFGVRFYFGSLKGMTVDIEDISTDKSIAEEFARRCINNRVSVDHLYEVLEDYLGIVYGV